MFKLKRIYAAAAPEDGYRVLVDGLWPRGLARAAARIDAWERALAPSAELRRWYDHDPAKWLAFRTRYAAELGAQPDLVARLRARALAQTVTLLFAARDEERSNAAALKAYLEAGAAG